MRLFLICLIAAILPLQSAEDRPSILGVGDDRTGGLFGVAGKSAVRVLSTRGIRFADRSERGLTASELLDDFERDVLAKEPSLVLLAIGANDLWDFRRKEAVAGGSIESTVGVIAQMLDRLQDAGIAVVLVTPLAGPIDGGAHEVLAGLATALRGLAQQRDLRLVDAHAISAEEGAWSRRGRLEERTAATIVAAIRAVAGISDVSLPRLEPTDRVVVFSDAQQLDRRLGETGLDAAFTARFGAGPSLVVVEKHLVDLLRDPSFVANQRPRSLLLFYGHRHLSEDQPVERYRGDLEQLLRSLEDLPCDHIILLTPFPVNDTDQLAGWDPTTPRGRLAAAYAETCMALGAAAGVAVIDLTSTAIARHAADPELGFLGQKTKGGNYTATTPAGAALLDQILRAAWSLDR